MTHEENMWRLFNLMGKAGGRNNGDAMIGREHRCKEAPIRDHMTKWAQDKHKDNRIFLSFDDPKKCLHFPPFDLADDSGYYIGDIKQPEYDLAGCVYTPEVFDATSNGIFVDRQKRFQLDWICGKSLKLDDAYKVGLIVYAFISGKVLILPMAHLQERLDLQASPVPEVYYNIPNKERVVVRDQVDPKTGNIDKMYAVPSIFWTYIGNYLTGEIGHDRYVPEPPKLNIDWTRSQRALTDMRVEAELKRI